MYFDYDRKIQNILRLDGVKDLNGKSIDSFAVNLIK